jgi:hypothetical protein
MSGDHQTIPGIFTDQIFSQVAQTELDVHGLLR